MADQHPKGSYTYPITSDDPDRTNVLKNRWGIETHSELRVKEYRATAVRMEMARKAISTKLTGRRFTATFFRMSTNGPVIRATKVPSLRGSA